CTYDIRDRCAPEGARGRSPLDQRPGRRRRRLHLRAPGPGHPYCARPAGSRIVSRGLREGTMTLRDIAHARTGDKGDICNISLIAFDSRDYPRIVERVTPERVRVHFAGIVQGDIARFELPHLGAVNF